MSTIMIRSRNERPELSDREVKRALVEAGSADFLAPHLGAEDALKHVLLEPGNDRILIEQVHDGGMAFENLGAAFFFLSDVLRHVAFLFALAGEPLRAVHHGIPFYLRLEPGGLPFKNA